MLDSWREICFSSLEPCRTLSLFYEISVSMDSLSMDYVQILGRAGKLMSCNYGELIM